MAKTNIINKGVHCKIQVSGSGLVTGTNYTACLYYSAKKTENRAVATADAQEDTDTSTIFCLFDFTPEQTAELKAGTVILEVYDTDTLQQMMYDDAFATVRSTSIKD